MRRAFVKLIVQVFAPGPAAPPQPTRMVAARRARMSRHLGGTGRIVAPIAFLAIAGVTTPSRAQCPEAQETTWVDGRFPWVAGVPYGDAPSNDVMYYPLFLFDASTPDLEDVIPGPPPWVDNPDFYCASHCPASDCAPNCPPGEVDTNNWDVWNKCDNIADEALSTENDWWATDPDPVITYNCLAYAVGARQGLPEEGNLWLAGDTCDDETINSFDLPWLEKVVEDYGWRPSQHCFSECGKRKMVAFGYLDSAAFRSEDMWQFFDVRHVAVEAGDGHWLESKFGTRPRILHKLFDLSGGCFHYGGPMGCFEMDVTGANPTLCDPGYDPFADPENQVPAEICDRWGSENPLFCMTEFCAGIPGGCPNDVDVDGDGIPWPLDLCPDDYNLGVDTDEDGVDNACDNCIDIANRHQDNCDEEFDGNEPNDRQGDACDPDPCARWHARNNQPLRPSVEALGDFDVETGRLAYFSFDGLGGQLNMAQEDHYGADETFQDVRPAYCSCAQAGVDCEFACQENVTYYNNPVTGTGWYIMSQEINGDVSRELMPDVPFVRGGPGGSAGAWHWQNDDCPGAGNQRVDCETLGDQRFHLWLRPMVDGATWQPMGWPDTLHNFYTPGEHHLAVSSVPHPPEEVEWPGPRLIPEGSCFHCDQEFFSAADLLPFVGEFAPGTPLPYGSPYRFQGYTSGDPVQGIALGLVDGATLAVRRYVPSKGLTSTHEPRVTGAMVAVQKPAGTGFDATLWLFGGIDRNGHHSNGLYRGDMVEGSSDDLDRVVWTRLTPASPPKGRVGALFAYDPVGDDLVLFGGTADQSEELGDFWRFDLATSTWSRDGYRAQPGESPGLRGFPAVGQAERFAFMYGGYDRDGVLLDDLYVVDLTEGTFSPLSQSCSAAGGGAMQLAGGDGAFVAEIDAMADEEPFQAVAFDDEAGAVSLDQGGALLSGSGPGPGPRSAADLAVEPDGRGLLLYGGVTASGPSNDLWRFDLTSHCWERLSSPCTGGSCQTAGAQGLAAGVSSRTAVMVASIGSEQHPSIAWHFEPSRAGRSPGWLAESEWGREPAAWDCDENGYPDSGAGFACATSTSWYDAPGARGCTSAGTVACPQVAAALSSLYSVSATSPIRIAARGNTLVLTSGTTVKRYRMTPGSAPVLTGTAALNGTAVGVVLDGPRAFVATSTSRVQAFSLAGSGIAYQGQRTFTAAVGAIGGDGSRLYVVSGNKLWVLDSSSPSLPTIGSVTLPQSGATALAVTGRKVVIAVGTVVGVVSVANPSAPVVQGTVSVGTGTTALRAMGTRVYAVKSGSNYVIDVSNPATPVNVGTHNAIEWAKGAQYQGRRSVRVYGSTAQVADIVP